MPLQSPAPRPPSPPALFYPGALWTPLIGHSVPGILTSRNLIVLHITEGPTASSAINTFRASVHPNRVSAHFVIDRDGSVFQLLPLSDTAWHASAVNSRSIGIEHAAIAATDAEHPGLPATDAQYASSSKLVAWLCKLLSIAVDRTHIRTHNEASPADGHTLCCTGALDPDRVVNLAQSVVI